MLQVQLANNQKEEFGVSDSLDLVSDYEMDKLLAQDRIMSFARATFTQSRTIHKQFAIPDEEKELEPELKRYWDSMSGYKLFDGDENLDTYQTPGHTRYLCRVLDWWVRTPGARLILNTPPRHGKSELCTKRLPAYLMGRFPNNQIIGVSYAQNLINSMSRQARTVCMTDAYKDIFPLAHIDPRKNPFGYHAVGRGATEEWETPNGSIFKAAGVGTGITGRGFFFGIIDDPVKGRRDAESETMRNWVWDWYVNEFYTRREPGARILIVMTRWHIDDLVGRIIKTMKTGEGDKYMVINLPAVAKEGEEEQLRQILPEVEPLQRKLGEALWEEKVSRAELIKIKEVMGAYGYSALFDNEPIPPGGELIDSSLFKIKGHAPDGLTWVRFYDPAVSTKTSANSTASVGMAMDENGNVYIRNLIHGQWNWPTARKIILSTCKIEGPEVKVGMEDAGQQKALIDDIQANKDFNPFAFSGYPVNANKKIRALPWIAKLEAGKVFLIVGKWNQKLMDIAQLFTGQGEEDDDIIDAISGAYQMLVGPGPKKKKKKAHIGWV